MDANRSPEHFDVIIVGGRPAGSTLAARLGQQGLRVLLVERSQFPSPPGASSPIIYSSTMALLDEVGADEGEYARNTPRILRMINASPELPMALRIPMGFGRDYAYAIDRARFDHSLWNTAARMPTVEARQGYSVIDLLWEGREDAQRVVGIIGQPQGGGREHITADLVIGADGRFSTIARKVNADERDVHVDNPTSIYYAYWKNVKPYDNDGPAAVAFGPGTGYGYLTMDSADGMTAVGIEGRAALLEPLPGKADEFYLAMLQKYPIIWDRLKHAERVSEVRGMKKIGNLYRQAGGEGWALVGDAYHQKDPIDGQGIYDAVYSAKLLAIAIDDWKDGHKTWAAALRWYDMQARAESYPMYQSTLDRVRASIYTDMPEWVVKLASRSFLRWMVEDPLLLEGMGMVLTRQRLPDQAVSVPTLVGALMRGPLRDLSRFLERQIGDETATIKIATDKTVDPV